MSEKAFPAPDASLLAKLDRSNIEKQLRIIDPYARYVSPQGSTKNSRPPMKYLGVELFSYRSRFWVRTDPGGSADIAGLPEIAVLHSIDGREISNLDLKKISGLLDEALKTNDVSLAVSSEANSQRKTYRISPSNTKPSSIMWKRFGTITVVRIPNFVSHETAPRLLSLYKTMKWEKGIVIIDLRNCSGGDLFEAIQIAGFFVPDGLPMVQLHDRSGKVQIYRAPSGAKRSTPAAVVIDRHTASAAEVFAGILQYHKLTRLVGETSYGKCVSQTVAPLVNGGTLWFTNILILFPDLHSCTGKGLRPDIVIDEVMVMKMGEILEILSKS